LNPYIYLAIAIIGELFGSSMLKASQGFTKIWPIIGMIIGFGTAFYFMAITIKYLPLSITYAIWSGVGTALTAVIGVLIWKEKMNIQTVLGILLIIIGVIVLNLKSPAH
jgi:small multidrug resistance pump